MNQDTVDWKRLIDCEKDFKKADLIFRRALRDGDRSSLLKLLKDLFDEFVGEGPYAGEVGTVRWMQRLYKVLRPSEAELSSIGLGHRLLAGYFGHLKGDNLAPVRAFFRRLYTGFVTLFD